MSEAFLGTARRWRPARFADVVGQEHVTDTLRNAIATHHVAAAYIFSGPRGVGKTTTARILAKALNCLHPDGAEPDNTCESCREINDGASMDIIEIDGASNNSVDDVRSLREGARYAPVRGKYKMYIIDEVHMLSTSAFNALLKTLEEPPAHLIFVLATTEISRVPATILSRCQRFDFRRMQIESIVAQLKKIASTDSISLNDDAALLIAKKADGAMRDALGIFDQIRAFSTGGITGTNVRDALNIIDQEFFFRATDIIHSRDKKATFAYVAEMMDGGIDIQEYIAGLIEHLRNLLFAATTQSGMLIETTQFYRDKYLAESKKFTEQDILRLLHIAIESEKDLRFAQQPRVHLEFALLRMTSLAESIDLRQLLNEIEEQKKNPVRAQINSVSTSQSSQSTVSRSSQTSSHIVSTQPTGNPIVTEGTALPNTHVVSSSISFSSEPDTAWKQVVERAHERRIRCWSSLEHHTVFIGTAKNIINLACTDDFHLTACKKNIAEINAIAKEFFGKEFSVAFQDETVSINSEPNLSAQKTDTPSTQSISSGSVQNSTSGGDPIGELLARELGAEEIH